MAVIAAAQLAPVDGLVALMLCSRSPVVDQVVNKHTVLKTTRPGCKAFRRVDRNQRRSSTSKPRRVGEIVSTEGTQKIVASRHHSMYNVHGGDSGSCT